jgi:hypothetical protein
MYILDKIALPVQPKMDQDLRRIDPGRFSAINHIALDLGAATILQRSGSEQSARRSRRQQEARAWDSFYGR